MILLHAMKQLWEHVLPKHFNSFHARGKSYPPRQNIPRVSLPYSSFDTIFYSLTIEISSRSQESSERSIRIFEEKSETRKREDRSSKARKIWNKLLFFKLQIKQGGGIFVYFIFNRVGVFLNKWTKFNNLWTESCYNFHYTSRMNNFV